MAACGCEIAREKTVGGKKRNSPKEIRKMGRERSRKIRVVGVLPRRRREEGVSGCCVVLNTFPKYFY